MAEPKLSRLELRIMEVLGTRQHASLCETSRKAITAWKAKRQCAASKRLRTFTSPKLELPVVQGMRRLIDDLWALWGERLTTGASMISP